MRDALRLAIALLLSGSTLYACAATKTVDGDGTGGTNQLVSAADSGSGGGSMASSASSASASSTAAMSSSSSGDPGSCVKQADCAAFADSCHAGNCVNGMCEKVAANDGSACDDGLFCTDNDACQSGTCVGGTQKFCPSPDNCHVGACDEATKACGQAPSNDGASCDDGDPCTYSGTCANGTCTKGQQVDCSALNGTCADGVCDPVLGCVAKPKNDGAACDDGLYCTVNDACKAGACTGVPNPCGDPVNSACLISNCNEAQKSCVAVPGNDGSACDDGNPCTVSETCSSGNCAGGVPGNNGAVCDDKNGCTVGTTCLNGSCGNAQSLVMQCIDNDMCCPAGCALGADNDCGFQFQLTQQIDGVTVTCSSVVNNAQYAECDDLLAAGLYFPNGISCGPLWSSQNSPYTDLMGFCQSLTGTTMFDVYYTCEQTKARSTWHAHAWGMTMDNGYAQHVRCYR